MDDIYDDVLLEALVVSERRRARCSAAFDSSGFSSMWMGSL